MAERVPPAARRPAVEVPAVEVPAVEVTAAGITPPTRRTRAGTLAALASLVACGLYLLNLGLGVVEVLPDNLPLVGNLDEAGATAAILYALRYLRRPRA